MTTTHRPTSASAARSEPTAQSPGSDAVAGGAITRLNPADGLFLRAEHLNRMQDYTAALVAAVGAGVGPGVAYGFKCTLTKDNDAVQVTGGLAFGNGRPLRSSEPASVSLKGLAPAGDDFWVVEIVPDTWTFGSEPVYGGLCEDPCGQGSGIRPYAAEGVKLRLRKDSFDDFGGQLNRRNWLASHYFEREREYGGESAPSPNAPWLLPIDGAVNAISTRPWSDGTGSYDDVAVPLGVVWKDGKYWQLDVWAARRDLGDPTPGAAWQWRLGWRPRRVFMAQILQFQAQLADSEFGRVRALTNRDKQVLEHCEKLLRSAADSRARLAEDVKAQAASVQALLAGQSGGSLVAAGFGELPPAGYLPTDFACEESEEQVEAAATEIFGDGVVVRVRHCRADYVAHAVEETQHMDRIPLQDRAGPKPEVDLLIPGAELADLRATKPSAGRGYGWSAFVRRRNDAVAEQRRDDVDVYGWKLGAEVLSSEEARRGVVAKFLEWFATRPQGALDGFEHYGTVRYPEAEWGVPIDGASVWQQVHDALGELGVVCLGVLGVANRPERQPLAAARAALIVAPERSDANPVLLPETYVAVAPEGVSAEAIVVFIGPQQGD